MPSYLLTVLVSLLKPRSSKSWDMSVSAILIVSVIKIVPATEQVLSKYLWTQQIKGQARESAIRTFGQVEEKPDTDFAEIFFL